MICGLVRSPGHAQIADRVERLQEQAFSDCGQLRGVINPALPGATVRNHRTRIADTLGGARSVRLDLGGDASE
jgi:hypothetical protein